MKKLLSAGLVLALASTLLVGCSTNQSSTNQSSTSTTDNVSQSEGVNYPATQLTITCPPAAGGGTDLLLRALAPKMQDYLGVPVIVVNKPGAGCAIGFSAGAKEANDGSSITAAVAEMLSVPYVADVDFTYESFESICNFNSTYGTLTVAADAPYDTVEEFIEYCKQNPGEARFSNSGIGGNWHVLAAAFASAVGIDVVHVPFDGGGPSATALAGGHVEATTVSAQEVEVHVASGKAKVLCSFSPERLPELPDVPTAAELGYGDLVLTIFRGFIAPAGTSQDVIEMIDASIQYALADEEITTFMAEKNFMKDYLSASEFTALMAREDAIYAEQFKALGLAN